MPDPTVPDRDAPDSDAPDAPGPDQDVHNSYRDLIRAAAQLAREDGERPWAIALTLIYGEENVTVTPGGIVVSKTPPPCACPPPGATESLDR